MLTLEAGENVRIKTVDSKGQPVAGVVIDPVFLHRTGKKGSVQATLCATVSAITDRQGVASFDWVAKGPGSITFQYQSHRRLLFG